MFVCVQVVKEYTFLDYIMGGCQINFTVSVSPAHQGPSFTVHGGQLQCVCEQALLAHELSSIMCYSEVLTNHRLA